MTSPFSAWGLAGKRMGARAIAGTLPYPRIFATARALVLGLCAVSILAAVTPARAEDGRWHAVLAAGDDSEPVFDNAARSMARFLTRKGIAATDIARLSAAPTRDDIEPATVAKLTRRIAGLPVGSGDRCLVFITSHGAHREGIWLARDQEMLRPADLAAALAGNCAAVPTVAIVSACYSGSFATGPMRAPNRIILTAARADRPSFGCRAGRTYTVFDECLLAALPQVSDWQALFRGTTACVSGRERAMKVLPSVPQAWFGAAIRRLPPWF